MPAKTPKTVAELYEVQAELRQKADKALQQFLSACRTVSDLHNAQECLGELAKTLYEQKDSTLKKLVRTWKKNKKAPVDDQHYLDIEDQFRGATKAFAPGFAHRYKLKLKSLTESE